MICPKCGGKITIDSNCERCRISYDELINTTRHDEMKRLFVKMGEMMRKHKNTDLEESLLACELANSSLLVPIIAEDDMLKVMVIDNPVTKKRFIPLFTDKEEYDKWVKDIVPKTNPFNVMIDLLDDDYEGFVINVGGTYCELTRKFFDKYFAPA